MVILFYAPFKAQVGEFITLLPINVAHAVDFVGVIVEGKVIFTIPSDDKASKVVMLI